MSEPTRKNYWQNRRVRVTSFNRLKRNRLLQIAFSIRAGTDGFVANELRAHQVRTVLDVACGAGRSILTDIAETVVGVDIEGFPADSVLRRGYREACVWGSEQEVLRNYRFDAVTIINLNAHIDAHTMKGILESVRPHCADHARFIFVNEYDNDNLLFRLMKKDAASFKRYVEGCEHWHFSRQEAFETMIHNLGWLAHERTRVIAANPAFIHLLAARNIVVPSVVKKPLCLFADFVISQINNLSAVPTGFLVGHTYGMVSGR